MTINCNPNINKLRKKLHRSNGLDGHPIERKAVVKCFDDAGHVLNKTSECPDRVPSSKVSL